MQRSLSSHHKNKNKITPRQIFLQKSAPPVFCDRWRSSLSAFKSQATILGALLPPQQWHRSHHRQSHQLIIMKNELLTKYIGLSVKT